MQHRVHVMYRAVRECTDGPVELWRLWQGMHRWHDLPSGLVQVSQQHAAVPGHVRRELSGDDIFLLRSEFELDLGRDQRRVCRLRYSGRDLRFVRREMAAADLCRAHDLALGQCTRQPGRAGDHTQPRSEHLLRVRSKFAKQPKRDSELHLVVDALHGRDEQLLQQQWRFDRTGKHRGIQVVDRATRRLRVFRQRWWAAASLRAVRDLPLSHVKVDERSVKPGRAQPRVASSAAAGC